MQLDSTPGKLIFCIFWSAVESELLFLKKRVIPTIYILKYFSRLNFYLGSGRLQLQRRLKLEAVFFDF